MNTPRSCHNCGWQLPTRGHHDRCAARRSSDVERQRIHLAKMAARRQQEQERRAREEVAQ